jgi:hypothetical protein
MYQCFGPYGPSDWYWCDVRQFEISANEAELGEAGFGQVEIALDAAERLVVDDMLIS